jgi:hypothetical protein
MVRRSRAYNAGIENGSNSQRFLYLWKTKYRNIPEWQIAIECKTDSLIYHYW